MTGMTEKTWGTFTPRGSDRLLLLIPQLGLGHGPLKRFISRAWLARNPGTPVDISYHKVRYRLYPWDNTVDQKLLFGSRYRDHEELEVLVAGVRNRGTFVDIGANTGYYSLTAAAAGAGRVLAIEPYPPTFERLAFNIRANDFGEVIDAVQTALGEHEGKAVLYVPEAGDVGSSRISDQAIDGRPVTVAMSTLADILSEHSIDHIDVMKIDVEGMEDAVLMPFFEATSREYWPDTVIMEHISSGDWQKDVLAWMQDNGYTISEQTRSNTMLVLR
jgi:FkbM family methyltransferase